MPEFPPRDAATVLLVRDADAVGGAGVQVWMMRRKHSLAFAPGAWVFPGGVVEPADHAPLPWHGRPLAELAVSMACSQDRARSLIAAAVRETFEECGVLLASGVAQATDEHDRRALLAGGISLADLLVGRGSRIDGNALTPWSWWLTPPSSPRRYDTWFFAVRAPHHLEPRHIDDGEAIESGWITPGELLDRHHETGGLLLPPTIEALERLHRCPGVDDVVSDAPERLSQRSG